MNVLGNFLKDQRDKRGLNQTDAAKLLNMDVQKYGRIERGTAKKISDEELKIIADKFEADLETLHSMLQENEYEGEEGGEAESNLDKNNQDPLGHLDGLSRLIILDPKNKEKLEKALYEYFVKDKQK